MSFKSRRLMGRAAPLNAGPGSMVEDFVIENGRPGSTGRNAAPKHPERGKRPLFNLASCSFEVWYASRPLPSLKELGRTTSYAHTSLNFFLTVKSFQRLQACTTTRRTEYAPHDHPPYLSPHTDRQQGRLSYLKTQRTLD